jgi:hypothetical protein
MRCSGLFSLYPFYHLGEVSVLELEVGVTYITRNGNHVTIVEEDRWGCSKPFLGDNNLWYTKHGHWFTRWGCTDYDDLVEVYNPPIFVCFFEECVAEPTLEDEVADLKFRVAELEANAPRRQYGF